MKATKKGNLSWILQYTIVPDLGGRIENCWTGK